MLFRSIHSCSDFVFITKLLPLSVALIQHDPHYPRLETGPSFKTMEVFIGVNETFLHQILRVFVIIAVRSAYLVKCWVISSYDQLVELLLTLYNAFYYLSFCQWVMIFHTSLIPGVERRSFTH